MMKTEALKLALDALGPTPPNCCGCQTEWQIAITAIKAALEAKDEPVVWNEGVPAMLPKQKEGETFIVSYEPKLEAKDEPVAWKWHQAPVKTSWGDGMVAADLAIDKDHTVSIYCERDQTAKVEAMFTTPQQEAKDEPDYKALWQQMCERCDELDKKLAQQEAKDEPVQEPWESEMRNELVALGFDGQCPESIGITLKRWRDGYAAAQRKKD